MHDAASTRCHATHEAAHREYSLVSGPLVRSGGLPRLAVFILGREAFSKRPQRTRPFANCSPNALTNPAAGSPVTLCLHGFDSRMGMRHVPRVWREAASIPATRGGASIGGRVVARGFQVSSFFSFSFVSFRLPFPPSSFPFPLFPSSYFTPRYIFFFSFFFFFTLPSPDIARDQRSPTIKHARQFRSRPYVSYIARILVHRRNVFLLSHLPLEWKREEENQVERRFDE